MGLREEVGLGLLAEAEPHDQIPNKACFTHVPIQVTVVGPKYN